jgi:hypothetical protein
MPMCGCRRRARRQRGSNANLTAMAVHSAGWCPKEGAAGVAACHRGAGPVGSRHGDATAELDERSRTSDVGEPGVGHAQKSRGHPPGWSRSGMVWVSTAYVTPPGDVGVHIADALHHRLPIALAPLKSKDMRRKANAERTTAATGAVAEPDGRRPWLR